MAEERKPQPATEPDAQKKRLLAGVGVAGLLIVVLLAVLAIFESYSKREFAPPSAVRQAPTPIVPPAPPAVPPIGRADEKPVEIPAEAPPEKAVEKPAEPKKAVEPRAEPEHTAAAIATPRPAEPRREVPTAKSGVTRAPLPGRKAEDQPSVPIIIQPPRPVPANAAGFVLQLGVFTNVANAEELRAKLTRNGIPSQIEARVLAGPFKTKQEAEVAQAKLKVVGVDAGLLIPFRAR